MNKLSLEELIEKLDWWRKIAHIGGGCKDRDICEQAYEQIKSLLQPVPEEKIERFAIRCGMKIYKIVQARGWNMNEIEQVIKNEYDKEKESADEK